MKNGSFVRGAVQISLFSALIACAAFFSFPIFSVPITLQSLAVFLALFILGTKRGTLAVILYVLLGIVGLPVFSGFSGGIGRILDIGGGFIFGFCVLAITYSLSTKVLGKSNASKIISALIGQVVLYACGVVWYVIMFDGDFWYAVYAFVLPFVLLDLGKIVLAFVIAKKIKKLMK